MESKMNNIEQYSRKNNIRISGIPETGIETAEATTQKIVQEMNNIFPDLDLQTDIARRLDNKKKDRHRQIIVKFNFRMKRGQLLGKRTLLKGTNIFVSEDLAPANQHVLACIRRKMPDEVDQSWSKGRRLFYKLKRDPDTIIKVPYKTIRSGLIYRGQKKKRGRRCRATYM